MDALLDEYLYFFLLDLLTDSFIYSIFFITHSHIFVVAKINFILCFSCLAGDSDSSSGDEFFWVGGPDGHNMRREHRKIVREDYNVLNAIFDTLEEKQFKLDEQARLEREAKEEAEKCPADVAGNINGEIILLIFCFQLCLLFLLLITLINLVFHWQQYVLLAI